MKNEKGKGQKAAGASIRPDESELLGNRLLLPGPQTAKLKSPPLRGATGGKHCNKPAKNPDYWPLADSADIRRKKSAPIRVICLQYWSTTAPHSTIQRINDSTFPSHCSARRNEKGKMKKEKGKGQKAAANC